MRRQERHFAADDANMTGSSRLMYLSHCDNTELLAQLRRPSTAIILTNAALQPHQQLTT